MTITVFPETSPIHLSVRESFLSDPSTTLYAINADVLSDKGTQNKKTQCGKMLERSVSQPQRTRHQKRKGDVKAGEFVAVFLLVWFDGVSASELHRLSQRPFEFEWTAWSVSHRKRISFRCCPLLPVRSSYEMPSLLSSIGSSSFFSSSYKTGHIGRTPTVVSRK